MTLIILLLLLSFFISVYIAKKRKRHFVLSVTAQRLRIFRICEFTEKLGLTGIKSMVMVCNRKCVCWFLTCKLNGIDKKHYFAMNTIVNALVPLLIWKAAGTNVALLKF